jgi:hypothetical protein
MVLSNLLQAPAVVPVGKITQTPQYRRLNGTQNFLDIVQEIILRINYSANIWNRTVIHR